MARNLCLLAILLLMVLTACGSQTHNNTIQNSSTKEVTVQIDWRHDTNYVGFYTAKENGYYSEQGLSVTIVEGGFDSSNRFISSTERVSSGQADFGTGNGTNLISAREQGLPLVAVSSVLQRNPLTLMSLKEKNLVKPEDLIGATVQITPNSLFLI